MVVERKMVATSLKMPATDNVTTDVRCIKLSTNINIEIRRENWYVRKLASSHEESQSARKEDESTSPQGSRERAPKLVGRKDLDWPFEQQTTAR